MIKECRRPPFCLLAPTNVVNRYLSSAGRTRARSRTQPRGYMGTDIFRFHSPLRSYTRRPGTAPARVYGIGVVVPKVGRPPEHGVARSWSAGTHAYVAPTIYGRTVVASAIRKRFPRHAYVRDVGPEYNRKRTRAPYLFLAVYKIFV